MNHKKVANENHEESTRYTTRSFSRHGVPRSIKQEARLRNRAAKRYVDCLVVREQMEDADYVDESIASELDLDLHFGSPLDVEDDLPLPDDYEECGDCGYDHAYEPVEAHVAHGGATH